MRVDGLTAGTQATSGPQEAKSSKDEFLKLLVAQLENQNPLEPQDGAEFVAQLAQFSAVEQSEMTNEHLAALQAEQSAASSAALANFVDKSATFSTDSVYVDDPGGGVPEAEFELGARAKSVRAVVLDESGKPVRTLDLGGLPPGKHTALWDGTDSLGKPVDPGRYRVEITSEAEDGTQATISTRFSGTVSAVDFSTGTPMMRMGGAMFSPSDVSSIGK